MYTPEGVHLFEHDLRAGVSTNGRNTRMSGQEIVFCTKAGEALCDALPAMLDAMEARGCRRVAFVPWGKA